MHDLTPIPDPRLPSSFDARLEKLIGELRTARSCADLAAISDHAAELGILVKRRRLGLMAQQQAAILQIEAATRIGEILIDIERQPVGRPKKNDSPGFILPTLRDLGLTPGLANRARRLAAIPRWLREGTIRHAVDTGRELTTKWLLQKCEAHIRRQKNLEPQPGGRVEDLQELARSGRKFGTIYMDPAWEIPGLTLPYASMTPDQIAALPIRELANPERCHLHLWTLIGRCEETAYQLIRHWGFRPVSGFCWIKSNPTGRLGLGQYWRLHHEPMLTAVLADSDRDGFDDHSLRSYGIFAQGIHSEKPEQVRRMVEAASPPPRIELFARREHEGWYTWGHEVARPLSEQVEAAD